MRLMKRNLQTIYYCTYNGKEPIIDEDGYETGEQRDSYSYPVPLTCSVSPAGGTAQTRMFGILDRYSKVLITDDMTCPIDEYSVLYIDKSPEGAYDYVVTRVARSLNHIAYAVKKVNVSYED